MKTFAKKTITLGLTLCLFVVLALCCLGCQEEGYVVGKEAKVTNVDKGEFPIPSDVNYQTKYFNVFLTHEESVKYPTHEYVLDDFPQCKDYVSFLLDTAAFSIRNGEIDISDPTYQRRLVFYMLYKHQNQKDLLEAMRIPYPDSRIERIEPYAQN